MRRFDRLELTDELYQVLQNKPGQNKYQLLSILESNGWRILTTSAINSVLYSNRRLFSKSDDTLPFWFTRGSNVNTPTIPLSPKKDFVFYSGPILRDWQREAFDNWKLAGKRGVVEAVTGTGKTAVGIIAAADAAERGLGTFILVPSLDLLDQWYKKLTQELPLLKIGRLGDGWADILGEYHVVVGTVQSGCRRKILPPGYRGLLVADEVHGYGTEKYSKALEPQFEERLGLTATYERRDDGIQKYLTPYFTPLIALKNNDAEVVANCSYARGLDDGILAHFRVGLIGVDFIPEEQSEYDELDTRARQARSKLISQYGCPEEPFGEFMKAVTVISEGYTADQTGTYLARNYLSAFSKRKAVLADSTRKIDALVKLAYVLDNAKRAIVFTETIDSAEIAAYFLEGQGISAEAYTSELNRADRKHLLSRFRSGSLTVLTAPKVLDEGIDVPEADVGVIVAASHSRRQMVQRMGRILRPKNDGRRATFIILYVRNTSEDPGLGAHEVFLNEMIDTADEIKIFSADVDEQVLLDWYFEY